MRPTGQLHLGNYFGAIKQFCDLQDAGNECYYFSADLHACTEISGPTQINDLSVEVVKNYIACGVDPSRSILYRQSDVPEISELTVLLGNIVRIGRLRACTTFKDRVRNKGIPEEQVSYGLLGYPVLMAADILCVRANRVPVGKDQMQHVEMARDFAGAFNQMFGSEVFTIPEINLQDPVRVPGVDGADKMGKSDGNTIQLLEDPKSVVRKVGKIPTQADSGGEMADGTRALYTLMDLCSPREVFEEYVQRYNRGEGKFFGEMKRRLAEDIVALLQPIQEKYSQLDDELIEQFLREGAQQVREVAGQVLKDMHRAVGLRRSGD